MTAGERPILRAGALELQLLPHAGGSVARFDLRTREGRRPLLRGTDAVDAGALQSGCFPLVPFCNRIRGGEFTCDERTIKLAPNMAPDPSPLHGQGWLAAWEVVSASANEAELIFHHQADEWPWAYEARQRLTLDPDGLSVTLTCCNLSSGPMPCGLGLHPHFVCNNQTRLDTDVESAWTIDEHVLPVERVPAEGRFDLRERNVCAQDLDHGFGGWAGSALVDWPDIGVSLRFSSPDAQYFQLFSPPSGRLIAAEPVQHANAALNAPQDAWESLGLVMLELGEARALNVRFEVTGPASQDAAAAAAT